MRNKIALLLLSALVLAGCSTQKSASDGDSSTQRDYSSSKEFFHKVVDNAVTSENIVGSASVTLKMGEKTITVPGSLRMRKDQVIRLQLFIPILGTEVGRLEFTPDYVLIVDRMNKQYIKGDYSQIDFLSDNGISFYSLQALFWNELVSPGKRKVTYSDAGDFLVDMESGASYASLSLSRDKMKYQWNASLTDNTLTSAVITYNSSSSGTSMLSWLYSNFTTVEKKKFPKSQEFSFMTSVSGKSQKGEITIDMDEVKTSSNWETETTISSKYKEVSAESVLSKLMSF